MNEDFYLIKEAATKVGVESHVLRYWEEELKMEIHRNAKGHRYYTTKDIQILSKVRELKDKGLQLKAIRNYLEKRKEQMELEESDHNHRIIPFVVKNESLEKQDVFAIEKMHLLDKEKEEDGSLTSVVSVQPKLLSNEEKMQQFQAIMNKILSTAIKENKELIGNTAGEQAAKVISTEMMGMTKEQEARAEERFQKLDQTLRELQKARLEAAATNVRPVDKRKQSRLKRKNNQIVGKEILGKKTK